MILWFQLGGKNETYISFFVCVAIRTGFLSLEFEISLYIFFLAFKPFFFFKEYYLLAVTAFRHIQTVHM